MNHSLLLVTIAAWLVAVPLNAQDRLAVAFLQDTTPATVRPASDYALALTLRNTGLADWNAADRISLAYHWVTIDGRPAVREGLRTSIGRDVPAGGEVAVCAVVRTPATPGEYLLQWDMVEENVTWFSALNSSNVLTRKVEVIATGARATGGAVWTLVAVFAAFVLHLALTTRWAWRRWGHRASPEVLVFQGAVMGLGSLHAVLHALVFTVGLGVWRTIAGLAGVQSVLWAWQAWHPTLTVPQGSDGNRADVAQPVRRPSRAVLAGAGWIILLALVLQWAAAAAISPDISGTDAAHYHVPHAVNFARGVSPFSFLATRHLYPMGISVWAAWLIQASNGLLLVDLATLPAFLLLAAACVALVHLLGGRPGLAWSPWLLLILFSSPLLRLSVQTSADLFYTAAFVALVTSFAVVWHDRRVDTRHLTLFALCAGMLVSTKITGTLSFVVVGGLSLLGIGARQLFGPVTAVRLRPRAWLGASILFLAAGGVWWLRSWWAYGSPIAPAGLQVFGVTIFQGEPYASTRLYLSVLGDLAEDPGYDLWARFVACSAQFMGRWVFPLAFLGVVLVADVLIEHHRHRRLSEPTRLKLMLGLLLALSFGIHAVVLAGSPWTSLEWTHGLSVRYLLPFFVLWILLWCSSVMSQAWPWHEHRITGAVLGAVVAGGALWMYASHQAMPGLDPGAWYPIIEMRTVVLAAVIVGLAMGARHARLRRGCVPVLVIAVCGLLVVFATSAATSQARAAAPGVLPAVAGRSCAGSAPTAVPAERGVYLHVAEYQRARGMACSSTRFFLLSRFDFPLQLQDAAVGNVVFQVSPRDSDGPLKVSGPRRARCDAVVVADAEAEYYGETVLAKRLGADGPLELVGRSGKYRAYVVR